jgi:protein involved in polysaccharide export with SLBB domain
VTLSEIRDINILISGNAFNPGIYTLNGNSNVLHALSMAGGINKFGSYRNILHLRNNEVIGKLDIYNLLINGKFNFKTNLKSGDVIFVDTVGNLVEAIGAFKRPGLYELSDDEPLSQALFFANGISKNADLKNIYIQRVVNGDVDSIKLDNIDGLNDLYANDGDKIIIREHDLRSIEIVGSVVNPGKYFMSQGENIFDAIQKAGGYTESAYKFGVIYENKVAEEISENSIDFLYQEFLRNLILMGQQNLGEYNILSTIQAAELMNDIEPNGRIIVDFVNPEPNNTFIVQDGDKITVPEKTNQVYVFGEVSSEGAVSFAQGKDVSYYLDKKGGFSSHADKSRIFIIHPNGLTQNIELKRNVFQSIAKKNDIYPGSIIYVPQSIDNPSIRRMSAQAYASILGNIAISLASLNSIQ